MIILASKSPRRKELLNLITPHFIVAESHFDESSITEKDFHNLPKVLAFNKANEVLKNYTLDDCIIGSDTIVVIDNQILGKPKDEKDARRMLKLLSNKTHLVITGLSVLYKNKIINKSIEVKVTFKDLSEQEITDYINTKEPFDKAGAYGIQGYASKFIKKIEGDYFSIVGLPVNTLYEVLKELKVI